MLGRYLWGGFFGLLNCGMGADGCGFGLLYILFSLGLIGGGFACLLVSGCYFGLCFRFVVCFVVKWFGINSVG